MRLRGARLGAMSLLFTAVLGCGGSVELRSSFPDNQVGHIETVLDRMPAAKAPERPDNASGTPLVVAALHGKTAGIAAFDVRDGREMWRRELPVDSTPTVGGPVVIIKSGTSMVGLDVRNGQELWRREAETIDYMGSAVGSSMAVMVFTTAGQQASMYREGRVVAVDALSGRTRWTIGPVEKQIGAPAVRGGVLFIPWDRLTLSALDLESGEELARLLSRDDVISYVRTGPEGVFYGSTGAYRLSKLSASGVRDESAVYEPLVANAPVSEGFYPDGFLGEKAGRSARNKIRFVWRGQPGAGDEVGLLDDTLYFLYYRIVFAFDAATGATRWVRTVARDAEAATVINGGLLLVDGEGGVNVLRASDGATVHHVELGVELDNAAIDVATIPAGGSPEDAPTGSVREQLLEVIFDPDARLTPARRFAVSLLAASEDEEATRDLLEVCRRRRVSQVVRDDAAMILRTRSSGVRYLIDALSEHYDFLADRDAPPVGVIASAVLHMEDRTAVPRLWQHMLDPETPLEDLDSISQVVLELGDEALVPQLREFVVRYRADSEFHNSEEILLRLTRAVTLYGNDEDREALAPLADDALTLHPLRQGLAEALTPPPSEDDEEGGAPAAVEEEVLPAQQLSQAMESARSRIRPCVQAALRRNPELQEISMHMVISPLGELEELTVEPTDDILGSCLTLSLAQTRFPRGTADRQLAEYTIRIE